MKYRVLFTYDTIDDTMQEDINHFAEQGWTLVGPVHGFVDGNGVDTLVATMQHEDD